MWKEISAKSVMANAICTSNVTRCRFSQTSYSDISEAQNVVSDTTGCPETLKHIIFASEFNNRNGNAETHDKSVGTTKIKKDYLL